MTKVKIGKLTGKTHFVETKRIFLWLNGQQYTVGGGGPLFTEKPVFNFLHSGTMADCTEK